MDERPRTRSLIYSYVFTAHRPTVCYHVLPQYLHNQQQNVRTSPTVLFLEGGVYIRNLVEPQQQLLVANEGRYNNFEKCRTRVIRTTIQIKRPIKSTYSGDVAEVADLKI